MRMERELLMRPLSQLQFQSGLGRPFKDAAQMQLDLPLHGSGILCLA